MLFETVCIKDGIAQHLNYHNERLNHTRKVLFGSNDWIDLHDHLHDLPTEGLHRAKIRYGKSIKSLFYYSYTKKPIQHIQIVEATIDYRHKYADRSELEALLRAHPDADEIILSRDGLLTDTTIANIALRQDGIWYTPTSPLLPGTTRARLLETGKLQPRDIHRGTLAHYDGFALMNAMIGFSEMKFIPLSWT